MIQRILLVGLVLCPLLRIGAEEAADKERARIRKWEAAVAAFEAEEAENPPPAGGVLFVGSSTIRLWNTREAFPDLVSINRGFGGSQLADTLHYLDRLVLKHRPRVVVIHAGGNDLAQGKSPRQAAQDLRQIVRRLGDELPQTRIVFIGIKPTLSRWKLVEQERELNRLVREFFQERREQFPDRPAPVLIEVDGPFSGPDGMPRADLLRDDKLHLNEAGYKVLSELVRPHLAPSPRQESAAEPDSASARDIFLRRILPIARAERASSCTECHFGGVELKNYIREDQAATFAALRAEGLIDVVQPAESKLLKFIARHGDQTDPLLARVREAEETAFRQWILAAVRDPQLLAARTDVKLGTELPAEVIRHMRRDRVLQSFVENIWVEIGRCVGCHSPDRNQRLLAKHGERISWIRPQDPAGTLAQCAEQGLIDIDAPDESLLLTKPLVQVEHGGGPKFALGSRTDQSFRRFLHDYAAVVQQRYRRADELPASPAEVVAVTGQHLRITDLPAEFGKKRLRADVYRWTGEGWSERPVATADNTIHGERQLWQSMLLRVAKRGSPEAADWRPNAPQPLPAQRYLVRIFVDRLDRSREDRAYELKAEDFFLEVETDGPWGMGHTEAKVLSAARD